MSFKRIFLFFLLGYPLTCSLQNCEYAEKQFSIATDLYYTQSQKDSAVQILERLQHFCLTDSFSCKPCTEGIYYLGYWQKVYKNNPKEALKRYQLAIELDKEKLIYYRVLSEIGDLLKEYNQNVLAEEVYTEVVNNISEFNSKQSYKVYYELSLIKKRLGKNDEAANYINIALDSLPEEQKFRTFHYKLLYHKAVYLKELGNYEQSEEIITEIITNFQLSPYQLAYIRNFKGNLRLISKQYAEALNDYKNSLKIFTQENTSEGVINSFLVLDNIAAIYQLMGQEGKLLEIRLAMHSLLQKKGYLLPQKDLRRHTLILEVISLQTKLSNGSISLKEADTLYQGINALFHSITTNEIDFREKLLYSQWLSNLNESYVSFLIHGNQTEKALLITERQKYRLLNEFKFLESLEEYERLSDLQILYDSKDEKELQAKINKLEAFLNYKLSIVDQNKRAFSDILKIEDSTTYLSFVSFNAQYYVFWNDAQSWMIDSIAPVAVLDSIIELFVKKISNKEKVEALSRELYQKIFRQKKVEKQIVISPSLNLLKLPFNALLDASGNYLIEDHDLMIKRNFLNIEKPEHRDNSHEDLRSQILCLTTNASDTNAYLKGSEMEAKFLKGRYRTQFHKGDSKHQLLNLLSNPYRIIHLSTHAFVENNFEASKLDFGTHSLNVQDFTHTDLNTDLVVLSACNSGLGKNHETEGILGLSYAIEMAGCEDQVLTLWPIHDLSSVEIMKQFYINLENKTAHKALSEAQRRHVSTQPFHLTHPYYWASFFYLGSSNNVELQPLKNSDHQTIIYTTAAFIIALIIFYLLKVRRRR